MPKLNDDRLMEWKTERHSVAISTDCRSVPIGPLSVPTRVDFDVEMETWNAIAQVGYTYDWGSLVGGYRYLSYDFDSDFKLMKDLDVYGPFLGLLFEF